MNSPLCCEIGERSKHKKEIDELVGRWTRERNAEDISEQLKALGVPCTPIPTLDEVCNDPHLLSRQMIVEVEQLISGKVKVPGSVFKLSETPGDPGCPSPFLGEHNLEVYSGILGYSEKEIEQLAKDGVI